MPTKANGPLQVDLKRMVKVAKWARLPNLVFHIGQTTIVMPLDNSYLERLEQLHPPAPDAADEEKREPRDWKNW